MKAAITVLAALICPLVGCTLSESPCKPDATESPRELEGRIWQEHEFADYVQFLLASQDVQQLRTSEPTELHLLEHAFRALIRMNPEKPRTFDYERYESIVASVRAFIKVVSELPLVKSETIAADTDYDVFKKAVKFFRKVPSINTGSSFFQKIFLSVMFDHLHPSQLTDMDMDSFMMYRDEFFHLAALNGNFKQLSLLVNKVGMTWNRAVKLVAPAIARSGSVDLFRDVLNVSSLQPFLDPQFWRTIIQFNKKELFRQFVGELNFDNGNINSSLLEDLCSACCKYQRQDLFQALVEQKSEYFMQINLTCSFFEAIKTDNTDMFRFMLSLDNMDESALRSVFSRAVARGRIDLMNLLLGTRPDGRAFLSDLALADNDEILKSTSESGRVDVLEFFLCKKREKDSRFLGFTVGMNNNAILCFACWHEKYELVKYLLGKDDLGEFIFSDVDPAAQNNKPLLNAIECMDIVKELLRQDEHGGMIYPGVTVTDRVLIKAADEGAEVLNFLLQTVETDDGSVRYKFPGIDINANSSALLKRVLAEHNP